jgi:hypothetical protein
VITGRNSGQFFPVLNKPIGTPGKVNETGICGGPIHRIYRRIGLGRIQTCLKEWMHGMNWRQNPIGNIIIC